MPVEVDEYEFRAILATIGVPPEGIEFAVKMATEYGTNVDVGAITLKLRAE